MAEPKTDLPDSAVDVSFQTPEAADQAMHLGIPTRIPIINITSETDRSKSIQSDKTEVQAQIATSIEQSRAPSKNGESPDGISSASLWCPATLRSHASLVEWNIVFCEFCKQSLSPPEKKEKSAEDNKEKVNEKEEKVNKEDKDKGGKEPDIIYKNKYLDTGNDILSVHTWHEQLDLERERQSINTVGSAKAVIEVISIVVTDAEREDFSWSDRNEVFQNIIKNPKVVVDEGGREIVVNSKPVIKALRKIITYYPDLQLIGQSLTLVPPYCVYYHHMEEIRAYQLTWTGANGHEARQKHPMEKRNDFTPCNEETYHHLSMLGDIMEKQEFETVTEEMSRYQRSPPVATYRMLWLLLKPGTTVYTNLGGSIDACVISSVSFDFAVGKPPEKYRVNLWYLDFDGVKLGRCPCHIDIWPFDGEREITHLDVIPSKYYDNKDDGEMRRRLESRGRKYFNLISGAQVDYEGETLGDQRRWVRFQVVIMLRH